MHRWIWKTWDGTEYLTCSGLEQWPHGFFTRTHWPRSPSELVHGVQPAAEVLRVRQVHGNEVLSASDVRRLRCPNLEQLGPEESPHPNADGIYSDGENQAVWVCSADCTPALIGDRRTGQVAAVHAGWRGTAAKILPMTIAQMMAMGSRIADLQVAMGPAISGSVYQVTQEVGTQVGESIPEWANSSSENAKPLTHALQALENPPFLADCEPGRVKLDVRRVNALQLETLGLTPAQIAIAPHCTFQDPERFFSYRRDGQKKVQWSGIVSQKPNG